MSYSYYVPAAPRLTLSERVDAMISRLSEGPSRDEALAHRDGVLVLAELLLDYVPAPENSVDTRNVSVSGHGSPGQGQATVAVNTPVVAPDTA